MKTVDSIHSKKTNFKTNSCLRVLFVSHAYVVGVNQGKLQAIAEIDGIEVGLLAPSNWKALEWNRRLELEKPYSKIQVYSAPVLFAGRGGAHIYAPWRVWQVLNDFQPDIVQVEEEVFSMCAFELAIWTRITGKQLVVFGWENMDRNLPRFRRWVRQFVLNSASAIIAGNHEGADLLRHWGYTRKIAIMPQMGVDTNLFAPQLSQGDRQEFHIGFLGRYVAGKGIDILFTAVSQLRQRGFNCRVILCGSGTSEADLRQEAEKQQIADLVIWEKAVRHEAAPIAIAQFDVLVLPSRTTPTWKEQFGHVLIEAMAMGVPVIGSTSGEIPHAIGRSDLIFSEEDAHQLAVILERLICDPNWRQEVKNYCLNRVQQHYSHERIAARSLQLWQTLRKWGEGNRKWEAMADN
ncbi:glycosyltransferase family 4 protein [Chroococcidiopsis sp. FACHB-1243]|uniref:glycosyltransferase n=1 Tax=Chroococcidiopsis sp. [FACHB-1243] TaxID=2692781 RepID=UPI00177DDCCB|nr:glycosyltransferase [Chroococcidiopsis sp. [FACHB-1243]]MBD2305549.1 glycosyltransferase family 4 protein [Chroococcidiopsis sp. [FACHB-1243]]